MTAKRLGSTVALATCFAGGLAAGHMLARWTAAPPSSNADDNAGMQRSAAVADARPDTAANLDSNPAAPPPAPTRTLPLPAREQPIASYYDELAQRAQDGDAHAARRLADDLHECATRERQLDRAERLLRGLRSGRHQSGAAVLPADESEDGGGSFADRRLDAAERFVERAVSAEKRCEGIAPETLVASAEWIRQAALAGDLEAKLCYAIAPNDWNRDLLSPQWVAWAERWNRESPTLVQQAFEGGLPEAAAVLSTMYSAWQPRDARPWSERLGDDPYWAYAYAVIAQQTLSADEAAHWSAMLRRHAARLSAEQIARADAWANAARARIRFQTPATESAPEHSRCRTVRRAGNH
ncbi:MAG: hypothetical protein JNN30_02355 [Rhodanobacteraceae bacterium]|nr:hypothetical protein [Rhodanobacteraceae bacterium]